MKTLMHLNENDFYVVRKGDDHTATGKNKKAGGGMRKPYLKQKDETNLSL